MSVFVTVGSTSFDDLISVVSSPEVLQFLASKGFSKIIFQIGKGSVIPEESSVIKVEWFRFKDDISDYVANSSLVIGHGGAGTILEALHGQKTLIVVLNESLMNNHQGELAEKLAEEGFLDYCTCKDLLHALKSHFSTNQKKLQYVSETYRFPVFLDEVMGFK